MFDHWKHVVADNFDFVVQPRKWLLQFASLKNVREHSNLAYQTITQKGGLASRGVELQCQMQHLVIKAYKTDNAAYVGRSNGVMAAIAKQFSNSELKELAGYVGSLDGELKVVPESRFR